MIAFKGLGVTIDRNEAEKLLRRYVIFFPTLSFCLSTVTLSGRHFIVYNTVKLFTVNLYNVYKSPTSLECLIHTFHVLYVYPDAYHSILT